MSSSQQQQQLNLYQFTPGHPLTDAALRSILSLFKRDFIETWYLWLCPAEYEFSQDLMKALAQICSTIESKAQNVDWDRIICYDLFKILNKHLQDFRDAQRSLYDLERRDGVSESVFVRQYLVRQHPSIQGIDDRGKESLLITKLIQFTLVRVFGQASNLTQQLLLEILRSVLLQIFERISDPTFLHEVILNICDFIVKVEDQDLMFRLKQRVQSNPQLNKIPSNSNLNVNSNTGNNGNKKRTVGHKKSSSEVQLTYVSDIKTHLHGGVQSAIKVRRSKDMTDVNHQATSGNGDASLSSNGNGKKFTVIQRNQIQTQSLPVETKLVSNPKQLLPDISPDKSFEQDRVASSSTPPNTSLPMLVLLWTVQFIKRLFSEFLLRPTESSTSGQGASTLSSLTSAPTQQSHRSLLQPQIDDQFWKFIASLLKLDTYYAVPWTLFMIVYRPYVWFMFGPAIRNIIRSGISKSLSDKSISFVIRLLEQSLWPDQKWGSPLVPRTEQDKAQILNQAQKALRRLLDKIHLVDTLGAEVVDGAISTLVQATSHKQLNKAVIYTAIDHLLVQLFADTEQLSDNGPTIKQLEAVQDLQNHESSTADGITIPASQRTSKLMTSEQNNIRPAAKKRFNKN
ncbi:hypothetical protein MIR68_009537 [Amoeboaphelidium protococcarum]|nr:hypothetical protein MIR68_009537 [Amoeboaphelidium protococcarum]